MQSREQTLGRDASSGSSIEAESRTASSRTALATTMARPLDSATSASARQKKRIDALSSAAVGSSSKVNARPEASAAASQTLRFEPVESMYIGLARCGTKENPSTQ